MLVLQYFYTKKPEILMQISFHGIKNIGSYFYDRETPERIRSGNYVLEIPKGRFTNIHVELTNTNGNDLEEYGSILQKYPNKRNPNALNFSYDSFSDLKTNKKHRIFSINGKDVDLNDGSLRIFIKLYNLMKKIATTESDELVLDRNYFLSGEASEAFFPYRYYKPEKDFGRILEIAHSKYFARNGAKYLSEKLSNVLTKYILNT